MPILRYVTDAELRSHLNMTTSTPDAEVELHHAAAVRAVEHHVGPVIAREVTDRVYSGGGTLVLTTMPSRSLVSVTDERGLAHDVAGLFVSPGGVVARRYSRIPRGWWTVVHRAGLVETATDVPEDVKVATLIIAAHLYETQRGTMVRPDLYGDGGEQPSPQGFAFPRRALQLLAPYALTPAVA